MEKIKKVTVLLMAGIMLLTSGCVRKIVDGIMGREKEYDSIVAKWKNETVFEKEAADDALNAVLAAAEAKDHDEFAENFTDIVRSKTGFDGKVNLFLDAFPAGLSGAELEYSGGGAGGSSGEKGWRKGASCSYECTLNGEYYCLNVSFCFCSDENPEEIGVESFTVMNKNARAYHLGMASDDPDYFDRIDLLCDIKSEEEMPARLIGGTPYLWTETDVPKLTADEMRDLLGEYGTLGVKEVRDRIGPANDTYKSFNNASYRHYYELQPENGEPRYAYIVCQTEYGKIYDAYVCTPYETLYDDPLYEMDRHSGIIFGLMMTNLKGI